MNEEQLKAELERVRAENATLHARLHALNHLRHDVMVTFKQVWEERDSHKVARGELVQERDKLKAQLDAVLSAMVPKKSRKANDAP